MGLHQRSVNAKLLEGSLCGCDQKVFPCPLCEPHFGRMGRFGCLPFARGGVPRLYFSIPAQGEESIFVPGRAHQIGGGGERGLDNAAHRTPG